MQINPKSRVSLHLDIRLKDGSIADSTRPIGRPLEFDMGSGFFSDKLEKALCGLKAGDKKKVMLLPEDAFGVGSADLVMKFPRTRFASLGSDLEEDSIILFSDLGGSERPGIVRALSDQEVTIDFNHPLADHVLLFDIEIVELIS